MSQTNSIKQLGARNMGYVVMNMVWSDKMDLIAIATEKAEIIIQRLNWQKILTYPAHSDNVSVRSLSWQNDEPILAAGYSDGRVILLDAEREDILATFTYDQDIGNAYFSKPINTNNYRSPYRNSKELKHEDFLTPLPPLKTAGGQKLEHEQKFITKNSSAFFLVVVLKNGNVHLLLLGALKAGTIDITKHIEHPHSFHIYDVRLNGSAANAAYVILRDGDKLRILHFHSELLDAYMSPMLDLATQSGKIIETRNYLNNVIQSMVEAWETVLLEMDNKLTKYINQQAEGQISADFLELLVFGYASEEIEAFLMQELTEKGLKKVATAIDLSCAVLQNLTSKPLHCVGINMFYFLNVVKGMSRMPYFFKHLLSSESADAALRACGSFLLKIFEMQQVIDQCINDLKSFFCWLCTAILRLHQREEEILPMTPEDMNNLAEYLNSFEDKVMQNEDGSVTRRKFNLEKISQYFEDRELQQIPKSDENQLWDKLWNENECLRNCSLLYPNQKRASLIQLHNKLLQCIDVLLCKPNENITKSFVLDANIICCAIPQSQHVDVEVSGNHAKDFVRTSYHYNEKAQSDLLLLTIDWKESFILEFTKDFRMLYCIRLHMNPGPFTVANSNLLTLTNLIFMDKKFYNENIVSILTQQQQQQREQHNYQIDDVDEYGCQMNENRKISSFFVQLCLDAAKDKRTQHLMPQHFNLYEVSVSHSIHDIIDSSHFKQIDANSTHLAVSGSRKVASILSDNCRKMTVFEMEIEDDEDETDVSQSSFLEISKESIVSATHE